MENNYDFKILSERLRALWSAEGYSTSTIKDMEFILRALSAYMENNTLEEYTAELGEDFITYCANDLRVCASRVERAKGVVGKLNRLSCGLDGRSALLPDRIKHPELPKNLMKSLKDYLVYCANEGNRESTIDYKYWICGRFLKNLANLGCTDVCDITGEKVQTAFLELGFKRYWQRIRMYLRYLYDNGLLDRDYSGLIHLSKFPMPQPVTYSNEEICQLENSFDLAAPVGIRNYAITLLMSRYGIRACDVAALTFGNIDFENNRLHFIQQKTTEPWEAELIPIVKAALLNYLEHARPNCIDCQSIFITTVPPYTPISNFVVNTMIWEQFHHANIDIGERRHGSRAFRSSIASNMVNDGISTEIVRNVLGHGTKYALKHYARIDVESMRICPLPVPEPTGIFAEMLRGKGASHNA